MDEATLARLAARVNTRLLEDEAAPSSEAVEEMLNSAHDRLSMRLAPYAVPAVAYTIVVEVAVRLLRLRGYEGSRSESLNDGGSVSNTFVDDVLDDYEDDIAALRRSFASSTGSAGVKFL